MAQAAITSNKAALTRGFSRDKRQHLLTLRLVREKEGGKETCSTSDLLKDGKKRKEVFYLLWSDTAIKCSFLTEKWNK